MAAKYVNGQEARLAAERAARASYGRLLALLAASTGDLAGAEDALSAAFEQALATWPAGGVPRNPEAWLLTVARNQQRDSWKSAYHRTFAPLDDAVLTGRDAVLLEDVDVDAMGEKRLELLFVCAHPAIDPGIRTPLMLQTVLGFDAARIGTAFAVPAAAMAQRLVRAKKKIKQARIPFTIPERQAMPVRLPAVLEAIYGCYAMAWDEGGTADGATGEVGMRGEARYLALTLARLLDSEPEAWGLAALITFSLARVPGREAAVADSGGPGAVFRPLEEQDCGLWDARLIAEGDALLRRAASAWTGGPVSSGATGASPGRFQLEAAIQAVHCARARTGATDWAALRTLYTALVAVAPSLGARVALAAVIGRVDGPDAGLSAIDAIGDGGPRQVRAAVERFQPFHAARAELLAGAGRTNEASAEFASAARLTLRPGVQDYLLRRAENG